MTDLYAVAREITAAHAGGSLHWRKGDRVQHPDGRTVEISSGQYFSNGRVSNFWYWHPVLEDGTLGPQEHGYGWDASAEREQPDDQAAANANLNW